jgi:hypothetical protein
MPFPLYRERKGGCLSCMILTLDSNTDRHLEDGNTVYKFVRHPVHPRLVEITLGPYCVKNHCCNFELFE